MEATSTRLGDYEVTEEGIVMRNGVVLNGYPDKDGYRVVCLRDNGNNIRKRVHRLVAEKFIPNPDNLPEVNHKDEDKTNNHVSNLEWVTAQRNSEYSKAKTYYLRNPAGEQVEIYNLNKFCKETGLNQTGMWRLTAGKVEVYKGWARVR